MIGPHSETPLHWAASNDDVGVLDALLDGGADIEARGAVLTGPYPVGRCSGIRAVASRTPPARTWSSNDDLAGGGQRQTSEYLLGGGADLNWVGYDRHTPLQAAHESGAEDLITWLRNRGAKSAEELA